MLSAFMAFIEQGDEVIVFEPFFDQLVHSIASFQRTDRFQIPFQY